MAYRLRMPAQLGEWLAELAGSEPEAAAEVGAALLALMHADAIPGRPLVIDPDQPPPSLYPGPDVAMDPREALDYSYQQMLESLQRVRREVAGTTTSRHGLEIQLGGDNLDPEMRAALERQLAAASELEATLTHRAQRLQLLIDRFRTSKETAKAIATAAAAQARIQDILDAFDAAPDAEDLERAASESAARLGQALAEARRLLEEVRADDPATADGAAAGPGSRPETDVLELRPDPLGSDARIFFAEEPTGTLTLLTVLEDARAVAEHHDSAIDLACELLEEIRDDGWPTDSLEFGAADSFTTKFFPGRGPDLTARATALHAAILLTDLRERNDVSLPRLAERAGLNQGQAKLLELQGARHAHVEMLAAYARALGGTLRLTISLDGEDHRIS
jgi:phage shock protein A